MSARPDPFALDDAFRMASGLSASLVLDRLADASDYAVIGPVDGRTEVRSALRHPHAAVCNLSRDFGTGAPGGCSGFLIGPRLVLTAGHCVYSALRKAHGAPAVPRGIRVVPGMTRSRPQGFGAVAAERWYAPRRFLTGRDPASDIGIIVLSRPVTSVRPLTPVAASDATLRQIQPLRLLHVAGYPADKRPGTMWEHAERLDRYDRRQLFYSVDTCPGHSGSPIWTTLARGAAPVAVGIHVAGPVPHAGGAWGCRPGVPMAPQGATNRGIRLTGAIVAAAQDLLHHRVADWLVRLDGRGAA